MKILLLGAGGQLAHDLQRAFRDRRVLAWTRADLDVTDADAVQRKISAARPDVVINATAYNLVDQAEKEPDAAMAVNALAPEQIARICAAVDATFVHYSTDYVFGGGEPRNAPWEEFDLAQPLSAYGASKFLGEALVGKASPRHFILRTCGLYGIKGSRGKGGNFVETMLRLADSGKPLSVVDDQMCTPSYTADVAAATARILETDAYGLYHLTNAGQCSWHQFATEIFRQAGKTVECKPITSLQYNAPAARPPFSVLSGRKLTSIGVPALPAWEEAVGRYLAERGRR